MQIFLINNQLKQKMDKYIKKDMEDSLGENVRRYFEGELQYQSLKERKTFGWEKEMVL